MRDDQRPHPGPLRLLQVDSELAGTVIAACFVILGLVSMSTLAPVFFIGAVPIGVSVAFCSALQRRNDERNRDYQHSYGYRNGFASSLACSCSSSRPRLPHQ